MISKEKKAQIIAEYGRKPGDTGSPEVQIAILTARIAELTQHLQAVSYTHLPCPKTGPTYGSTTAWNSSTPTSFPWITTTTALP